MNQPERHPLISGMRVTALGTLLSRILGMVRDIVTAAMLGRGAVSDAFFIAFRFPNLFRRLFGEGALTASYLPVLTVQLDEDKKTARQLASVVLVLLAAILTALTAVGELCFAAAWFVWGDSPDVRLLLGLAAVMLPYLLLVCVAAQLTTMLHAARHFAIPAITPAVLNVVWLGFAWVALHWFPGEQSAQAYVLAIGVAVAGMMQIAVQLPMLRRMGYHFDYNWAAARKGLGQIGRNLAPMLIGLSVTQINTFNDSLIAWGLAAAHDGPQTIAWLGDAVRYPMQQGAATALYYGERLYEVPVGIVGMGVAAAIFPLLSRHAARGDHKQLGFDMTLGLKLILFLSVPAGAGLMLLGEPIARLLFERGHFRAEDTASTAAVIYYYATAVWAYCAVPVVIRGFYALNDCGTPVRVAAWMVGLNLALNLTLIWPLAEAGLAASTAIAAVVQLFVLVWLFSRRCAPLDWRQLFVTAVRSAAASAAMAAVLWLAMRCVPRGPRLTDQLVEVFVPVVLGGIAYLAAYRLLGGRELAMLLRR
jgi:putative peptidoglycan lipid II flippase